jgi:hypothetical protein
MGFLPLFFSLPWLFFPTRSAKIIASTSPADLFARKFFGGKPDVQA